MKKKIQKLMILVNITVIVFLLSGCRTVWEETGILMPEPMMINTRIRNIRPTDYWGTSFMVMEDHTLWTWQNRSWTLTSDEFKAFSSAR